MWEMPPTVWGQTILVKPSQEPPELVLSDFGKSSNAKFARKLVKAWVVNAVGNNAYELEDLQLRHLGVYHAKDNRVFPRRRQKINQGTLQQCGHTSRQKWAPRWVPYETASMVTDQAPSGNYLIAPNDFVDSGQESLDKEKFKRV